MHAWRWGFLLAKASNKVIEVKLDLKNFLGQATEHGGKNE
jgi:hypothetical protein